MKTTEVSWIEKTGKKTALWYSEAGFPAPSHLRCINDTLNAETALRYLIQGQGLIWSGDFHNARQLLKAIDRRWGQHHTTDPAQKLSAQQAAEPAQLFWAHRQKQAARARILHGLLIPVTSGYQIPLRRAPVMHKAFEEALGPFPGNLLLSLQAISGIASAHEWRRQGVEIAGLEDRIYPHYGVYSPLRGEYIDLLLAAPLPTVKDIAFDIGTGTGVLAALLLKRGYQHVIATDLEPRALACARDNLHNMGLLDRVELQQTDIFPSGKADLIVCNPPWIPAQPGTSVERAVYDPDHQMLRGFLQKLTDHLNPGGEGWLIISDLAEHLGLRQPNTLQTLFDSAGLIVLDRLETCPKHPKATHTADPLHHARSKERTSLWRLAHR